MRGERKMSPKSRLSRPCRKPMALVAAVEVPEQSQVDLGCYSDLEELESLPESCGGMEDFGKDCDIVTEPFRPRPRIGGS